MSFYEDFIADHVPDWDDDIFIYESIASEIERKAKKRIWTTREGKDIPVSKMTSNHIQNTINFIKRNDKNDLYSCWLKVFEEELENRNLF